MPGVAGVNMTDSHVQPVDRVRSARNHLPGRSGSRVVQVPIAWKPGERRKVLRRRRRLGVSCAQDGDDFGVGQRRRLHDPGLLQDRARTGLCVRVAECASVRAGENHLIRRYLSEPRVEALQVFTQPALGGAWRDPAQGQELALHRVSLLVQAMSARGPELALMPPWPLSSRYAAEAIARGDRTISPGLSDLLTWVVRAAI